MLSICYLRNPTSYSNIVSALNKHTTVHFKLSSDNKSGTSANLKIDKMSTIHISALATYKIQVQIASSLSWLSAAFRHSSHVKVMYSSTLLIPLFAGPYLAFLADRLGLSLKTMNWRRLDVRCGPVHRYCLTASVRRPSRLKIISKEFPKFPKINVSSKGAQL
jgi:hypothetical protein